MSEDKRVSSIDCYHNCTLDQEYISQNQANTHQDGREKKYHSSKPISSIQLECQKSASPFEPQVYERSTKTIDHYNELAVDSFARKTRLIDVSRASEALISWCRHRSRRRQVAEVEIENKKKQQRLMNDGKRVPDEDEFHWQSSIGQTLACANGMLNSESNCDCFRNGKVPTSSSNCFVEQNLNTNEAGRHKTRIESSNRISASKTVRNYRNNWFFGQPLGWQTILNLGLILISLNEHLILYSNALSVSQSDPRPTIYSGQISFGLLLSAHTSTGSELSVAASNQQHHLVELSTARSMEFETAATSKHATTTIAHSGNSQSPLDKNTSNLLIGNSLSANQTIEFDLSQEASEFEDEEMPISGASHRRQSRAHERRQIFERPSQYQVRRQQQQQQQQQQQLQRVSSAKQQAIESSCGLINPNALYAGMGAIWASHQANLVGDSQLAIGTYVYDSCNDLDVGQRQAVRIVSNLNAFQQTTCESPRGSPISLTIAHGDNQLRAIQLLTSFKVPVITTKEHFALEDYHLLSKEQRRFLFSTAPSSRHLAIGALKFSKRVVSRSTASAKLPNQFHKMSSKNGLIVISRNLPAKFITYLTETISNHVNYEMLQSNQPIDQVRTVEALELILNSKNRASESASSQSESRLSQVKVQPDRIKRYSSSTGDDSDSASSSSDSDSSDEQQPQQQRMLSPTIVMFITPSEAIDLVTRLRNDLAEVSRYYSLIVTTREDISPALRTIFHRGGSRLCSGKAFYTISPKPDEVSEFSRYFRDTVQMEGETSDHPLVCEYAKHASASKTNIDLDDVSTESVIKAVWSAAAAFKLVHKRECSQSQGNLYTGSNADSTRDSHAQVRSSKHGRQSASTASSTSSSNKSSAQSECLVKMNKNMSNLVQRALKKLDVNINSTGLQALDGFRIKFDETNELLTNKFSIKYINKECEITEIGQYTGLKEAQLELDDDTLSKSLESTLPDPWPVTSSSASPSASTVSGISGASIASESSGSSTTNDNSPSSANEDSPSADPASTSSDGSTSSSSSNGADEPSTKSRNDEESDSTSSLNSDNAEKLPSISLDTDSPKRKRSDSKAGGKQQHHQQQAKHQFAMSSGRAGGLMPIMADFYSTPPVQVTDKRPTTNGPSLAIRERSTNAVGTTTAKPNMRKIKPYPNNGHGSTVKEWLPRDETTTTMASTIIATTTTSTSTTTTRTPRSSSTLRPVMNLSEATTNDLSSTQAPVQSTLPESGGNTDLEMPAFKTITTRSPPVTTTVAPASTEQLTTNANSSSSSRSRSSALEVSATNEASDYVTLPSVLSHNTRLPNSHDNLSDNFAEPMLQNASDNSQYRSSAIDFLSQRPRLSHLSSSSMPTRSPLMQVNEISSQQLDGSWNQSTPISSEQRSTRSKFRSHLKWIYGSWFTMTILGANICGALLTLYVLTFLLMKNCDGSLDRENQGIRSMHLLAIIVVFFGSTLFIVYPTPGLCLLRTSWHNFALVLIFGSLLLQTMQTRSINSIGLGGRPNRFNQFLTLVFMVGVQVSFELQRWKYESANYVNFVNQYLNSNENGDKKLMILTSSLVGQFNPLNSFNDQVTPVSIQVSEQYQSLLHEYCSQPVEDFLQSQVYLWILIGLLVAFSISARRSASNRMAKKSMKVTKFSKSLLTSPPSSGNLLDHHQSHESSATSQVFDPFASNVLANAKVVQRHEAIGNVFMVTLISAPIYLISIILHVHGQNLANHDLISSISMVLIAFTILIGTFFPVLRQVNRYSDGIGDKLANSNNGLTDSNSSRSIITNKQRGSLLMNHSDKSKEIANTSPSAFAMFPEFASTGLRKPSSIGGESGSHAASGGRRRPFADTKESRRQMGVSLANLPAPSADSLRSLCVYNHHQEHHNRMSRMSEGAAYGQASFATNQHDPSLMNLKLNLAKSDDGLTAQILEHDAYLQQQNHQQHHHEHLQHRSSTNPHNSRNYNNKQQQQKHHNRHHHNKTNSSRLSSSSGEKRLIMLDVDPCCPRHGVAASSGWSNRQSSGGFGSCLDDGFSSGNHGAISSVGGGTT